MLVSTSKRYKGYILFISLKSVPCGLAVFKSCEFILLAEEKPQSDNYSYRDCAEMYSGATFQ